MALKKLLKENAGIALLITVLAGSVSLNVILGWKVKPFGAQRQSLNQGGVQENVRIPMIPGLTVEGRPEAFIFNQPRPTVLYILSPSCVWTRRNYPNIAALASAKSNEFLFVGVSNNGNQLKEYLSTYRLPFRVLLVDSPDIVKQFHFDVTPQTVVLGPGGRVEKVWVGAFLGPRLKEVEDFFGVKLPGVQQDATVP